MNRQLLETAFQYGGIAGALVLVYLFLLRPIISNMKPPPKHKPSEKEMEQRIKVQRLIVILSSILVMMGLVGYYYKNSNEGKHIESTIENSPGSTIINH